MRDPLGARPGDEIEFVPRGEEFVVDVRYRRSVLDFAGIAAEAAPRVPGTAEELDEQELDEQELDEPELDEPIDMSLA